MIWKCLFTDYKPALKCDPLTAFMIGSSLVKGVGDFISQSDTNRSNVALARESREWQSQENEKNRQFSRAMWNSQNFYNSPVNQRKLAEEGGYNPYLLSTQNLGSGAGVVGSPASSGAPNVAHVSPVNPMNGVVDSISSLMPLIQQGQQIESNVELQHTKSLETIHNMLMDAYKNGGQKQYNQLYDSLKPVLAKIDWSNSYYGRLTQLAIDQQNIEKERSDLRMQIEQRWSGQEAERKMQLLQDSVDNMQAQTYRLVAAGDFDKAHAYALGAEIARNLAQANLFGQEANKIASLLPYMVSSLQFAVGNSAMSYLENLSTFSGNEKWRQFKNTDFFKNQVIVQNQGQAISSFIKGFTSIIGDLKPLGGSGTTTTYHGSEYIFDDSNYVPFGR